MNESIAKSPRIGCKCAVIVPRVLVATLVLLAIDCMACAETTVVVLVGAEGTLEYGREFAVWADRWRVAAENAGAKFIEVGRDASADRTDRDRLRQILEDEPVDGADELWLVLIGHGTFDGRVARFNLRGSDLTDAELATLLARLRRPTVVIDCSSSSGPFINRLSAAGRVVIAATRSGNEQNFARFGDYFSAAIADLTVDYDRDGQVSLLEAFLAASRRVAEFYRTEARLATEHALLDDNGDGLGTPGDWFRGLRASKRAKDGATLDGHRARQLVLARSDREQRIPADLRAERDRLELGVAELRDRKDQTPEEEYFRNLELLLVELAQLQERVDRLTD